MKQKPRLSIILPTYNERENIEEMILRINNTLCEEHNFEIIVVDDDSPDKTWEAAENIKKTRNIVKVIRKLGNKSLPKAITTGVKSSQGDTIIWMDCDLSMPPEVIPRLVDSLENSDVAIGSRYVQGGKDLRPFSRMATSLMFNFFASLVLGLNVKDCNSGFVAVKRKVFKKISLQDEGYGEYFTEFIYDCHRNNFKINEVPYTAVDRVKGMSKTDTGLISLFCHGLKYSSKVLRLKLTKRG